MYVNTSYGDHIMKNKVSLTTGIAWWNLQIWLQHFTEIYQDLHTLWL